MNDFKSKLICEYNKFSGINIKRQDEIRLQKQNKDKKIILSQGKNNKVIEQKMIKFEKDEIKLDLTIKKAKFFEIENIKITNIGCDKGFQILYMVIDTHISSDNFLFLNNSYPKKYKLTMDGPLYKGESLNNLITCFINEPKIGEYTIFTYIREDPKGDNLSPPLKITVNVIED